MAIPGHQNSTKAPPKTKIRMARAILPLPPLSARNMMLVDIKSMASMLRGHQPQPRPQSPTNGTEAITAVMAKRLITLGYTPLASVSGRARLKARTKPNRGIAKRPIANMGKTESCKRYLLMWSSVIRINASHFRPSMVPFVICSVGGVILIVRPQPFLRVRHITLLMVAFLAEQAHEKPAQCQQWYLANLHLTPLCLLQLHRL